MSGDVRNKIRIAAVKHKRSPLQLKTVSENWPRSTSVGGGHFYWSEMQPEKRMLLASVLLAVAQQDAKNVKWLNVRPSRMTRISEAIAEESRAHVASEGFEEVCQVIDLDAEVMRELSPDKALEAYNRVVEGKYLLEM
jgi:hypothetical protein